MATLEELKRALVNAEKAGDTPAAQLLAAEIAKMEPSYAAQVQEQFDALPWYGKAAQALDDTARNFANTITFGLTDRLAAAANGTDLEEERQRSDDARTRAGSAAIGTDILALIGPSGLASKAVGTAVPFLRGSGLLRTTGREALAGGAIGVGTAAGNDEDIGDAAISGVLGGAAGGAIGHTAGNLLERSGIMPGILSRTGTEPLDTQGLRALREALYDNVDNSGIGYTPGDVGRMLRNTRQELMAEGMDPEMHKFATRRQNITEDRVAQATGDIPLQEMDMLRRLIRRDVRGNAGELEMGSIMRRNLDEFIDTTTPNSGGVTADEASDLIRKARDAKRREAVSRDIDSMTEEAANSASGPGNLSPWRRTLNTGAEGWDAEEKNLLRNIVRGLGWDETLSRTGVGIASHLGSIGSGATAGGILGGPLGATIGGISAVTATPLVKRAARKFTQRNIEALRDKVGGAERIPSWLNWLGENASGGVLSGTLEQDRAKKRRRGSRGRFGGTD